MAIFKFEKFEVWQLSLELNDLVYEIINHLPKIEEFNLKNQILRASTSVSLNIAEGSTTSSNPEQIRFLKIALHSAIEIVACKKLIDRRKYISDVQLLNKFDELNNKLFAKLNAFIKALSK